MSGRAVRGRSGRRVGEDGRLATHKMRPAPPGGGGAGRDSCPSRVRSVAGPTARCRARSGQLGQRAADLGRCTSRNTAKPARAAGARYRQPNNTADRVNGSPVNGNASNGARFNEQAGSGDQGQQTTPSTTVGRPRAGKKTASGSHDWPRTEFRCPIVSRLNDHDPLGTGGGRRRKGR